MFNRFIGHMSIVNWHDYEEDYAWILKDPSDMVMDRKAGFSVKVVSIDFHGLLAGTLNLIEPFRICGGHCISLLLLLGPHGEERILLLHSYCLSCLHQDVVRYWLKRRCILCQSSRLPLPRVLLFVLRE